jgi:hypothetical protein
MCRTGLPDFCLHNIPKIYQITIKYIKRPHNIPNSHKNRPNVHIIYQHIPLQDPPDRDFWFENLPPGNPGAEDSRMT